MVTKKEPDEPQGGDQPSAGADFITKLVKDPAEVPAVARLFGFLGRSTQPDHTRLYLNPDLSLHLDIPDEDILLTQPVPKTQDPLGGVHVWLKRDAKVLSEGSKGDQQMSQNFTTTVTVTVPSLTWCPPTVPTVPTYPTLPSVTLPVTPTVPTVTAQGGGGGGGAEAQGTLTPIQCTITPICGGGQTISPITFGSGGGGGGATPTFTHTFTPMPPVTPITQVMTFTLRTVTITQTATQTAGGTQAVTPSPPTTFGRPRSIRSLRRSRIRRLRRSRPSLTRRSPTPR